MKGFIIDSFYKENIIIDNNQTCCSSPNILLKKSISSYTLPIDQTASSYINHHQNNSNLTHYNIIDYL